jgi:hypothetical protein
MTDGLQGLRDDVAFMRGLAEEGRRAPLLGGSISLAAGLSFGTGSLMTYAVLKGWVGLPLQAISWIWAAAAIPFFVVLIGVSRRLGRQAGANSGANRANGAAWTAAGFAIFALFGAFILGSARTGEWIIMALLPPVILALYGAAWTVAAALTDKGWIRLVASGTLVLAVACGWLAGTAEQYLIYGAALLLFAALPGAVLMRQAREA